MGLSCAPFQESSWAGLGVGGSEAACGHHRVAAVVCATAAPVDPERDPVRRSSVELSTTAAGNDFTATKPSDSASTLGGKTCS
jgi:hypothetical protein